VKSLHITNAWHSTSGGIGTFYRALFDVAAMEGHHIRLVAPGEKDSVERIGEHGLVYLVAAPRAPLNPDYRLIYPHRFLFPQSALQRILNHEEPDLVEVSDKYSAPYLTGLLRTRRLPGVRCRPVTIGMSHERMDDNMSVYLTRHVLGRAFCRWYMRWIYFPMFDHHLTVSEHTAEELILASRGHKIDRGIWVSPMGVDKMLFTPMRRSEASRAAFRAAALASPGQTILFYAGRLAPEKNLDLLLSTTALLDPALFQLVVAGDGIAREHLERECVRKGLRHVTFLGRINDRRRLADYYAAADVFLHPNPREPFGIAPLEAMASGLPLIAPNSGGIRSYATAENAWLAAAHPASFAEAVHAACANEVERQTRAVRARRTAEAHDWNLVARRYLALYRDIHAVTRSPGVRPHIAPRAWSTPAPWPMSFSA
jgi:alpha-1,6-mannosyltransferase